MRIPIQAIGLEPSIQLEMMNLNCFHVENSGHDLSIDVAWRTILLFG